MAACGRVLLVFFRRTSPAAVEPLRALYPGLRVTRNGAEIPLDETTSEEVLAACCAAGIRVRASTIDPRASGAIPVRGGLRPFSFDRAAPPG